MAGGCVAACSRTPERRDGPEPIPTTEARDIETREIDFGTSQKAVVITPRWGAPTDRYPLLIALHGRGESGHGLATGAWGWVHDYWLDRAFLKLRKPPLDKASLLGITDDAQLGRLNGALSAKPFGGLVVACPYTPDILGTNDLAAAEPFAEFVERELIPRLQAEFPVDAKATGIDGVSLGGRVALLAAFSRPKLFRAIGTLQAAIRKAEVEEFARRAKKAFPDTQPPMRLLTSSEDPFRTTLQALSNAMLSQGVKNEFAVVPGPHDYAFNRGPGSYEMLMWHDRVLRSEPRP